MASHGFDSTEAVQSPCRAETGDMLAHRSAQKGIVGALIQINTTDMIDDITPNQLIVNSAKEHSCKLSLSDID